MEQQNRKQSKKNKSARGNPARRGPNASVRDNALMLRPEYRGQPVMVQTIPTWQPPSSTTVTTGIIAVNLALSSALISSFATRFAGFTEFRIIRANARVRCFSTVNPGVITMWYSEDDTAAPTSAKAIFSKAIDFSAAAVIPEHRLSYVPHDPAQQTWTLVSSGAPVIGYFKLYTDNASFGSSIVATPYLSINVDLVVQFRGFV